MKFKKSYIATKLDTKKGYDRIECKFIFQYLQYLGFHERWIARVAKDITTVFYSPSINNQAYELFQPSSRI